MSDSLLCRLCSALPASFTLDWPDDGEDVCDTCLPAAIRVDATHGHAWPNVFQGQYPRFIKVTPIVQAAAAAALGYDQSLVDYTVRNLTTGDEENVRVRELSDAEFEGFPDAVRDDVHSLVARINQLQNGETSLDYHDRWCEAADAEESILAMLLPYISDRSLYDSNYASWEQNVLEGQYTEARP